MTEQEKLQGSTKRRSPSRRAPKAAAKASGSAEIAAPQPAVATDPSPETPAPSVETDTTPAGAAPPAEGRDLTGLPIDRFTLADLRPDDHISKNFQVFELTRSELAYRLGIDNAIDDDEVLRNAVGLVLGVMQPIRTALGPFFPNSVYRCQELERVLKQRPPGWISTSPHTLGCACDIDPRHTNIAIARWAEENLADFDQIVCECYDPARGPNSGWVHISLDPKGKGRRELLTYEWSAKARRWVYRDGLPKSD